MDKTEAINTVQQLKRIADELGGIRKLLAEIAHRGPAPTPPPKQ